MRPIWYRRIRRRPVNQSELRTINRVITPSDRGGESVEVIFKYRRRQIVALKRNAGRRIVPGIWHRQLPCHKRCLLRQQEERILHSFMAAKRFFVERACNCLSHRHHSQKNSADAHAAAIFLTNRPQIPFYGIFFLHTLAQYAQLFSRETCNCFIFISNDWEPWLDVMVDCGWWKKGRCFELVEY